MEVPKGFHVLHQVRLQLLILPQPLKQPGSLWMLELEDELVEDRVDPVEPQEVRGVVGRRILVSNGSMGEDNGESSKEQDPDDHPAGGRAEPLADSIGKL